MASRPAEILTPLSLVVMALVAAGCGGGGTQGQREQELSLLLDAPPSAVHAGIYVAAERDFDRGEGLVLTVRRRRPSTQPIVAVQRERVGAAVLPLTEFARARASGADLVAVCALVQTPLTAVAARSGVRHPRDLVGSSVAVPGHRDAPEARALVQTMVGAGARGGRRARVKFENVPEDFGALSGAAAAVIVRRDTDLVTVAKQAAQVFRPQQYGVPAYPELVIVVAASTLQDRPAAVSSLVRTLQRGYSQAQVDPESAVTAMLERERRLERNELLRQLDIVSPAWTAGAQAYGQLRRRELDRWQRWAVEAGLLRAPVNLPEAFAFDVVGRLRNP